MPPTTDMKQLDGDWKTDDGKRRDDNHCTICEETYPVTQAAILPCGHSFCSGCIQTWGKNACPACRRPYEPQRVVGNVNEFFKRAIEKQVQSNPCIHHYQVQDSGVGNGKIESVLVEGNPNLQTVSDAIDWTKVTKIKLAGWKK